MFPQRERDGRMIVGRRIKSREKDERGSLKAVLGMLTVIAVMLVSVFMMPDPDDGYDDRSVIAYTPPLEIAGDTADIDAADLRSEIYTAFADALDRAAGEPDKEDRKRITVTGPQTVTVYRSAASGGIDLWMIATVAVITAACLFFFGRPRKR